jgi:hypothetical protein
VIGIKISLSIVKCFCHFFFFLNIGFKGLCLNIRTFLYINHSWLKLTACFFFLAIVFTKQCWYCSQKFHIYALSFLYTASSHNYTKLNVHLIVMCNKTLPSGIKFNTDSYFNHIWQYDWRCSCTIGADSHHSLIDGDAQQVPCHGGGAVWHNHFINFEVSWKLACGFFCVHVYDELGRVLFRIPEGTGTTWKN